jgi:hypothetical protein
LVPIPFTHAQGNPIIDGLISSGEWDQSEKFNFRMTNGVDITLKIIYTETDIYFLATFPHNSPGDVIVREPWINNEAVQHDYFGIEFDNNKDGVIMGTSDNPDDMILIDYKQSGAVDMFSWNNHVYPDESNRWYSRCGRVVK